MSEKQNGKQKSRKERKPRVLLDVSSFPHDDKGHAIVPDAFMDENYRNLPDGTINESKTKRAHKGGMLSILGSDPEHDAEIHRKGGQALQAALKQRKTLAESLEIALRKTASPALIAELNLPEGSTNQDAITAAIILQAGSGNTKAYTALRDTIGEMPVSKQEIKADVMTDADRALIEKLAGKMNERK
jgi:general stress protein YciG